MSYFESFSNCYDNNHEADDSSTVFDADTVVPDNVPSLPTETATATTDYLYNNNNVTMISSSPHSSQEESPQSFTSEFLRRFNSTRHHPTVPSTTTTVTATPIVYDANTVMFDQEESPATVTRSEEISRSNHHQSLSSSSSSKKRSIITNSSSHSSNKKTRRSSRLIRQSQPQDQSCVDKSDSEVDDENELDEAVINQSSSSSQTSTTKLTKREARWRSKFEELRAYKQLHGHTSVPQSNKQLVEWVSTQRKEYNKFKKNGKSQITPERIELLESIDFEWVVSKKYQRKEPEWNKRFNELKEYKELHGHTNVTRYGKDDKQLGNWVSTQRTEYRKFKKNGKAKITPERIELLESIDFEWVSPNKGGGSRNESAWNERFNELSAYKELHGHTNVQRNSKDNKELGIWVKNQRQGYKKFQANKKSQITSERIEKLNSIGFQW